MNIIDWWRRNVSARSPVFKQSPTDTQAIFQMVALIYIAVGGYFITKEAVEKAS